MHHKIYFICPDDNTPFGGIKQIYRQVDILNSNGFQACVLHKKKGFRCTWFKNETTIDYDPILFKQLKYVKKNKSINLFHKLQKRNYGTNDILVFPEIYGESIRKIEPGIKKVIFNQNCYYTFWGFTLDSDPSILPYDHKDTIATIVPSLDSQQYLYSIYPNASVYRIRLGINQQNFFKHSPKKKQIVFMPRKLNEDVTQVINILKVRGNLVGWEFIPIENKTEEEVGAIMREGLIYLSFNYNEGFGLPPVEAMACSCIVIGYAGQGGKEYFNTDFSYPVEDRNIISFVSSIEEVVKEFESTPDTLMAKGELASKTALNTYNYNNEKEDILAAWRSIIMECSK